MGWQFETSARWEVAAEFRKKEHWKVVWVLILIPLLLLSGTTCRSNGESEQKFGSQRRTPGKQTANNTEGITGEEKARKAASEHIYELRGSSPQAAQAGIWCQSAHQIFRTELRDSTTQAPEWPLHRTTWLRSQEHCRGLENKMNTGTNVHRTWVRTWGLYKAWVTVGWVRILRFSKALKQDPESHT